MILKGFQVCFRINGKKNTVLFNQNLTFLSFAVVSKDIKKKTILHTITIIRLLILRLLTFVTETFQKFFVNC